MLKNKKTTLDDLAGMTQVGFMDLKNGMKKGFESVHQETKRLGDKIDAMRADLAGIIKNETYCC